MNWRISILFLFVSQVLWSQSVIWGVVSDSATGKAIGQVHVQQSLQNHGVSNSAGEFVIQYYGKLKRVSLVFSHLGYKAFSRSVVLKKDDTVFVKIKLSKKVYELKEFTASDVYKPQEMFHTLEHYVYDFDIYQDHLVMLTFRKNIKKDPSITLCDFDKTILAEMTLSEEPKQLFRDFAGRMFIEYENRVEWVQIKDSSFLLTEVDMYEYQSNLKPCKDSVKNTILFSDQVWFLPRFNYFGFDVNDSMVFLLKEVVHTKVNHMLRWTYYDMKIDDQARARKIADHFPELDKQEVAGLMSGFQHTIYYEQPYAPLFVKDDTILLFDHYSDWVYRYTKDLETIDSVEISYHKPKKRWTWKDKIYFDEKHEEFFGLFRQNGYTYLKQINLGEGNVVRENKLQNQFVEKVRVHQGYAYYIYKPMSSPTKPFIYRELLSLAD